MVYINIQKTKIMASGPIVSWQIDGENVEIQTDFIFLGSSITKDDDCSHEIKRYLLLGRKTMTNLDSVLKSRDNHLADKGLYTQSKLWLFRQSFGCESWTIKKAECLRIDAFELQH